MFINNDDLEKCGLFWYVEDPYLKILQTDARKLLAVIRAAEKLTGGFCYDHAGWLAEVELLKELQHAVKELETRND